MFTLTGKVLSDQSELDSLLVQFPGVNITLAGYSVTIPTGFTDLTTVTVRAPACLT